jgi:uncharacterized RDD family membrane protein YckC
LDRALERVDLNKQLERLDVHELIERAELGAIVARSTAGALEPIIDGNRAQLVIVDQFVQGVGWIRKRAIPHSPRIGMQENPRPPLPAGVRNIAVAVQGRYAGTASRVIAFLLDQFIIETGFLIVVRITQRAFEIIARKDKGDIDLADERFHWSILPLFALWQFVYYVSALVAAGRTVGKVFIGLKVVNNCDGISVSPGRAALRTLLLPLSIFSVVGVVCGLVRSDRREFHDLVAVTGVVYNWDARMARYREEKMEDVEHEQLYTVSSESFVDDDAVSSRIALRASAGKRHRLFSKSQTARADTRSGVTDSLTSYQRGSLLVSEF